MDIFQKCHEFTRADEARAAGLYPFSHEITSRQHAEVTMYGRRTVMLGSNNYLGLTSDDRVIEAAKRALDAYGTGCSGSRHLNGTLTIHNEMERQLADFFGKAEVMSFSTGFQTNLGILAGLCSRHDNIYSDRANHASLVDGGRLSFGQVRKFPHNDMVALEELLARCPEDRGKLIAVDGVFSMEGDLADLPNLVRLKKKYGARLLVDDSHGAGVMGPTGRGVGEYFGLMDDIDLYMGTFSKSFASLGGFVAGDHVVIDYLKHSSRPYIFSASMPPSNVAAVMEALRILKEEPDRPRRVNENADYMRRELRRLGLPSRDSIAPIIPISAYLDDRTFVVTRALLEHGVYVNPVISPAVPVGDAIVRTSYIATHTKEQLDFALEQLAEVLLRLYPISAEEIEVARQAAAAAAEAEGN
ncbi:MAG: aminotransferase class I/II-fold pyridoxal phosphate-dependent enzyme [Oscillospiraceae bacterium]|nr:aminotransferase class I/II-fold pyridoxal phosphate-dependent enzyme [Oscillospiraceae bacterium]